MRHALLILAAILIGSASACSHTISVAGVGTSITADDGYPLTAYRLHERGKPERRPPRAVVFYVQGSEDQTVLSAAERLASFAAMGIPIAMIERRGVTQDGLVDSAAALRYCTREVRVADNCTMIDEFTKGLPPSTPVILIGASEGGDVTAEVARRRPRVTHLMLLGCGGGWSQAEELAFFIRRQPGYLGIPDEAALEEVFRDIRAQPESDRIWLGHPYRRWASFLWSPPVDAVEHVRARVFLAHGEKDESVPVESARAMAEKLRGRNVTYREYAGVDHSFKGASGVSAFPLLEIDGVAWLARTGVITQREAYGFASRVKRAHPEAAHSTSTPIMEDDAHAAVVRLGH